MKNPKVWVIVGATDGLGPAAVRYLVSKKQRVIALLINDNGMSPFYEDVPGNLQVVHIDTSDLQSLRETIAIAAGKHGLVDFIINNSNYRLFNGAGYKECAQLQNGIVASITETTALLKELLPYLHKYPQGSIINIPPQLCLATIKDKSNADRVSSEMGTFLKALHKELQSLNCPLTFLEPGERLTDFSV
jgi:short-subunit dehydrogenase